LYYDAYKVAPGVSGVRTSNVAFGEEGWVNPGFFPKRNASGYRRFNVKQFGSGLERAIDEKAGAKIFNSYNKLQRGQPGWTHAQNARKHLASMGVTPGTASDWNKFEAMDAAMRGAQWKNQRKKRKFGIKDALGIALQVGSFFVPGSGFAVAALRGGMGATGAALRGGDAFDIVLGAAGSAFGGKILGALGKTATTAGKVIGGGLYGYGVGEQYVFNPLSGDPFNPFAGNPNRSSASV
jgi:hypothetical protein